MATTPTATATATVACPRCDRSVDAPVPGPGVEATPSPYRVAFGDHREVHCPAGHRVWVYYC
ncbi:hypothetical protein [Halomarina ordinaria]|uniref:Uncharacterized protein n=1 Tax=Halomarina ordinaria TaxID=3033939 RepID=A0ABD5UA49_9EURY|nr:hypothetical protein [Halomarina sp. PSRA2]